jgi:hypothetical protein
MIVVTDKEKCYKLAKIFYMQNKSTILNDWELKKTLNDSFSPDAYYFFVENNDLLPVVAKDNICYFFGGNMPFNDDNRIVKNKKLLNNAISFFKNKDLEFVLTSIDDDALNMLDFENKKFDVPFNQKWIIENINNFNIDSFIAKSKKKKRDKLKRAVKLYDKLKVVNISNEEYVKVYLNKILSMKIKSFEDRGKKNAWVNHKGLYRTLFKLFFEKYDCVNNIIFLNDSIVASYNLVKHENEIFLAFSNCYDNSLDYVQFFTYIDIIKSASDFSKCDNSICFLNAGRGNFGYKKRMGFIPVPMYALVDSKNWIIKKNKDITENETMSLYKRDFGCFCKT